MPSKLLDLPDVAIKIPRAHGVCDDFYDIVTGDIFTTLVADSGSSVATADAAGGQVTLTTGGTDNNEVVLRTTREQFLFANDKPLLYKASARFTQAATNAANMFVGVADAMVADTMVDNGAGPKTSFSGAAFYSIDGSTSLFVITSLGTTQTKVELTAANTIPKLAYLAADSSLREYAIEFLPKNSTQADVAFYINGVLVYKVSDYVYTSATEMHAGLYMKCGTAASQTLIADYLLCYQNR